MNLTHLKSKILCEDIRRGEKMKVCILISLFGLLFSCSNIKSDTNFTNSAINGQSSKSDQVVLEVITTIDISGFPKVGDILQMRLYEDGHFEYDDFPDYDPPKITDYNVVIIKKEATLSPEDVKELVDLAEQPDFLSAKEYYSSLTQHLDTSSTTKIKYKHKDKEKKIVADNIWDTQYVEEIRSKYPPSLLKLLVRVEELKGKAIGRTSTQWLNKKKSNLQ